jgi:anti-anti-sigma factor
MRHQVPFIGERKVIRADDDQARAKRTSGRVIDEIVGDSAAESSWEDVVPVGWNDKSQPDKPMKKSALVPTPKPLVLYKPARDVASGSPVNTKVAPQSSGSYSGRMTLSDASGLDWIPVNNGRGLRVNIHGCIGHELRKEWNQLLNRTAEANIHEFEFNLTDTPALSLTGLGMLLLFKERKGAACDNIKLCNCNKEIEQLLRWTGMDQYFAIHTTHISNE